MKPRAGEWPTYNGVLGGNRYSPLNQIDTTNVRQLQLQWIYALRSPGLETTPLVSDGVMYVTAPNEVYALDSRSGVRFGAIRAPRHGKAWPVKWVPGSETAASRSSANRVFFVSEDAHLICLASLTGGACLGRHMCRRRAATAPLPPR